MNADVGFLIGSILGRLFFPMLIPVGFGIYKYMKTKDKKLAFKAAFSLLPLALAFICLVASLLGNAMSALETY